MIKVIITDDHPVVRQGIKQILEADKEHRIGMVDEAESGTDLIKKMMSKDYDVIILDISMPGRSGLEILEEVKRLKPKTAVVMMSMMAEDIYALRAMKMGASSYINKTGAPEEIITAVVKTCNGGRYIPPSLAEKLSIDFLDNRGRKPAELLSSRELEVINLLAAGKTVSAIAKELSLSPKTISTYRERILDKLSLKTTSDIIRYALREGLATN